MVKAGHSHAVPEHTYRKWFWQVACAAGDPGRGLEYGYARRRPNNRARYSFIAPGLPHADGKTTLRHIRRRGSKLDALADIRRRKCAAEEEA